jgi:hypothetical protein
MRSFIAATTVFVLSAMPALARDIFELPEPDSMFLVGVAAAGLLLALRKKKK